MRTFLVLACLLVAPGFIPASAAAGLAVEDVARLRSVGSAAVSPDGRHIAYTLSVPRPPLSDSDGAAHVELHVTDVEGRSRAYVTGEGKVSEVAWMPDGTALAFLAKRGKDAHTSLYLLPLEGGEARRALTHGHDLRKFSLSPDGKRVAFLAKEPEPKEIKELAAKGIKAEVYEESERPVKVWIASIEDGAQDDAGKARALPLEGSAISIAWSPKGDRLAVALAPSPLVDDEYMRSRLHVVDVASGKSLAKSTNEGKLGDIAWSPDGAHLAYLAAEDVTDPLPARLFTMPAKGGKPTRLLPGCECDVTSIAWQDPRTVMFTAAEGVTTSFGEIGLEGKDHKVHVKPGGEAILGGLSLSRDGQTAAFLGHTASHPAEVFVSSHASPKPKRITTSNPWLAKVELAPQSVVRFQARDGLALEGILIEPRGRRKKGGTPLVLIVHGGPESFRTNGWVTSYAEPGQVLAARGIAAFYPNYRASGGRGAAFARLDHGDPGGKEFDDLVDAIAHLAKTEGIDRKKVGITGRSYGGYATAWGATKLHEHFAAGVMGVGLSDLISFQGTTDIPDEMYEVHWRFRAWEDWNKTLERSPVRWTQGATTPLLILHGKDDTRVHPAQSIELYRYLKLAGKAPVRLVLYPGEKHATVAASARLDYSLRLLRWMEHYLKGPGGTPPPYRIEYPEAGK